MATKVTMSLVAALGLSACGETYDAVPLTDDPITAVIAGKTLTSTGTRMKLGTDKSLTGVGGPSGDVEISGAWEVRDGRFCRTLAEPVQLAGTECQDAELGEGTITIAGLNGPVTYLIE